MMLMLFLTIDFVKLLFTFELPYTYNHAKLSPHGS
jgi:hypothetical protein